ncbi:hypothetical protein FRB94_007820 [Tulasnella sp. JGI-2019a]|nr:hypothetical protein FRB94_007820 [Tulasnella sp. JGI-2019a]KAG9027686.1 hypothetical protein FRB95_007457 [Tulasnella sp. JGI-2019a]
MGMDKLGGLHRIHPSILGHLRGTKSLQSTVLGGVCPGICNGNVPPTSEGLDVEQGIDNIQARSAGFLKSASSSDHTISAHHTA